MAGWLVGAWMGSVLHEACRVSMRSCWAGRRGSRGGVDAWVGRDVRSVQGLGQGPGQARQRLHMIPIRMLTDGRR